MAVIPICERALKQAECIYIAVDKTVADDFADCLTKCADTIEALVKVVEAVPCECDYDHSCHRCRALTLAREGARND